ncbi:hypothetical protein [Paenibacillus amylolyticus]|uniref:Uncharacterized protein n=1 Tax=Paenibacillus amylolyticus TaxID=1451 RepID=A0ABD8B2P5_PAEAM
MKISKILNEVRIRKTQQTIETGNKIFSKKLLYITKYESSISIKCETKNAVLLSFVSSSSTFLNRTMDFQEPTITEESMWIPKSCFKVDVDSDSFEIEDWVIKKQDKVDIVARLIPYKDRGVLHHKGYTVMEISEFEIRIERNKQKCSFI